MLPTFSVNTDVYAKMPKVTKLNLNPSRQLEQEWLSEAYLKIIEGKSHENINLGAYSAACERNSQLARAKKNEVSILNNDEMLSGYKGVTELVADCVDNSIDSIINSADIHHFVSAFIDMREYVYLEEGKDLWRLLELSRMDDKKAQKKLRLVLETYDNLKELIEYVIKTPLCYSKLEGILC